METATAIERRQHEALERARERHAALTIEQRQQLYATLVFGTHRVMCWTPVLTDDGRYRWLPENLPEIGSDDCLCKGIPMRYSGPSGPEDLLTGKLLAPS